MLINSLIGVEYWKYDAIDSHVWWPYAGSAVGAGIAYLPGGRRIKHITRESSGPIVAHLLDDLTYSGCYNVTAAGPSNENTEWTFYSAIYASGDYANPILVNHGSMDSNQYGKAKKTLYFTGSDICEETDIVRVWAESTKYITFADTIELICEG